MFTLQYINDIFPESKGEISSEKRIKNIMTDSREKMSDTLFIPIIGERFDGHQFIEQAIQNGAIATIWDRSIDIPKNVPESFVFFLVDDTVKALQSLAKRYRDDVNPTVIGITGSNGKTTTKDLVYAVLQTKYKTHRTSGNFNNEIGLPLTILRMNRDTEVLVLEMGMNAFGEIERLTKIAQPDYAIITNIGESHIEHLGDRQGIAKAKLEIKEGLKEEGVLFIDGDESLLHSVMQDKNTVSIGFNEDNNVVISDVRLESDSTVFHLKDESYEIPLLGGHHAKNATFAIQVGKHLGLTYEQIKTGLKTLEHTSMRFEKMIGKNGVTIINDAYNASPTSMKAAIEVLKQLSGYKRKVVVLGDILELGPYSESLHRTVAEKIDHPIDIVLTYGDAVKVIVDKIKAHKKNIEAIHFDDRDKLLSHLEKYVMEDTVILFKASRGMKFELFIEKICD